MPSSSVDGGESGQSEIANKQETSVQSLSDYFGQHDGGKHTKNIKNGKKSRKSRKNGKKSKKSKKSRKNSKK